MDYRKDLLNILAEEKSSINELKGIIKEKSQFTKKIKEIKHQLEELSDSLQTLENEFNIKNKDISACSQQVKNLYNEVFKDDLLETVEIIQDNLPNAIEGTLEVQTIYPMLKLKEKVSGQDIGEVIIDLNEDQEYIVEVKVIDKRVNFQCQEKFTLKKPNRIYKVISYINTSLNYDE